MMYAVALLVVAVYCWALASARPFTIEADLLVVAGFVAMGAPFVGALRRRRRPGPDRVGQPPGKMTGWVAALVAFVAVELSSYFGGWSGGRQAFPTISSLYDEVVPDSVAARAVLVFLWLAMGWELFRPRGARRES